MEKTLQEKVYDSIGLILRARRVAYSLNYETGFIVAFSGGKDSQCVLELCRMAGVKYKAYYSVTGIDAPANVHFIQKHYPEVEFLHPKENYFQLVEKKGLPMIQYRYCCERLKERVGIGHCLLDGVRAEESKKRSEYTSVMVRSRRKVNVEKGRNRKIEDIEAQNHRCINGNDRIDIHPILEWSEADVWQFIKKRGVPINPCYEMVSRVGCMYCPFAQAKQLDKYDAEYPLYKKRLLLALRRFLEVKSIEGIESAEEYYEWWKSKMTLKQWAKRKML